MSMLVQLGIRKTFCMVDGCVGKRFLALRFKNKNYEAQLTVTRKALYKL